MQRQFNLSKWKCVSEGKGIEFPGTRPRVVRLEVNAREPVGLYVIQPDISPDAKRDQGEVAGETEQFLALVEGRETVEFHCAGKFTLCVDEGECFVYTVDGDVWTYVDLEPRIFTKMATRRQRNPEIELMSRKLQINMQRMLEQQANEIRRDFERREKARGALPAPGAVPGDARQEPKPKGDDQAGPDKGNDQGSDEPGKGGKGKKGQGGLEV